MAIKSNPAAAVQRWQQGVGAAGGRYVQGVQGVTDWAGAATAPAAVQARNAGLQRAISEGRIDRGIQAVGTQGWKNATVAKAGNWQTGVNSPLAQQRAQAGFARLFGYLQQAENDVSGQPRGGFAENMQRMTTYLTSVHNAAQNFKAGQ